MGYTLFYALPFQSALRGRRPLNSLFEQLTLKDSFYLFTDRAYNRFSTSDQLTKHRSCKTSTSVGIRKIIFVVRRIYDNKCRRQTIRVHKLLTRRVSVRLCNSRYAYTELQ